MPGASLYHVRSIQPDPNGLPMTDAASPAPSTTAAAGAPGGRNRLAPVALVLALLVPVAGAVLGHITLRQIAQTGEGGRGLALAATIIGWVGTVAWFAFWGVFLATLNALGA